MWKARRRIDVKSRPHPFVESILTPVTKGGRTGVAVTVWPRPDSDRKYGREEAFNMLAREQRLHHWSTHHLLVGVARCSSASGALRISLSEITPS
jgi:hypothetical protein